jgi:hypothetical protein
MSKKLQREATLKSEIINRVKAIELKKSDKKAQAAAFNKVIAALEAEKRTLLSELAELQNAELAEEADEILEEAGSKELTTKNLN